MRPHPSSLAQLSLLMLTSPSAPGCPVAEMLQLYELPPVPVLEKMMDELEDVKLEQARTTTRIPVSGQTAGVKLMVMRALRVIK